MCNEQGVNNVFSNKFNYKPKGSAVSVPVLGTTEHPVEHPHMSMY